MTAEPVVSVVIAAHGRPVELRQTLRELTRQTYGSLEVIVVDDGSPEPLGSIVRDEWPDALLIRHDRSIGYNQSRSEAMSRASGSFILTLDDDSSPSDAVAIQRAVDRFLAEPELGVVAFLVDEGEVPAPIRADVGERYVHDFVGCGHMMRTEMVRQVGDYRDFFYYYSEEMEYAIRAIDRGWRILFVPSLVVHHRQSMIGRSRSKIVGYRLRNTLWTIILNYPFPRVVSATVTRLAGGMWDVIRLWEWRSGVWALGSCLLGLPRVIRDRTPVSSDTMRKIDLLKFRWIAHPTDLHEGERVGFLERIRWYRGVWPRRRRFGIAVSRSQREDAGNLIFLLDPREKRPAAERRKAPDTSV